MGFSFIQITDHHLGATEHTYNRGYATAHALGRVMDAVAARRAHGADFLMCTGDVANEGIEPEYTLARRLLGITHTAPPPGPLPVTRGDLRGLPAYFLPGNHDVRAAFFSALFAHHGPTPPTANMAFTHEGVQFVCLDMGTHQRAAQVLPETLAFLRGRLATGQPAVLLMHYHPVAVGIPWLDRALPEGIDALWDICAQGRVLGVLFGHAHTTVDALVRGIPVLGLRSTNFQFAPAEQPLFCLQPPHYRVVSVTDSALTSEIFEVAL